MFNNPFDSFHNTVAEAKEEREQLDRLLTISTPRERLLVVAIAALLLILVAWLFLGNVSRSLTVGGILVESGEGSVGVLVWVARDAPSRIEAGMPAMIECATTNGETETLEGTVSAVLAAGVGDRPTALASLAPVAIYRVAIGLDEEGDAGALAGGECRIVFVLDSQSPVALLGLNRS